MSKRFKLLRIPNVKDEWETRHRIFALEVNKKCCVLDFIGTIYSSNPNEYKKIMKVIKLVACFLRVKNTNHVKPHRNHSGIYEIIAKDGNSRISFFYDSPPDEDAICVLSYWKTSNCEQRQNAFFEKSVELMNLYHSSH